MKNHKRNWIPIFLLDPLSILLHGMKVYVVKIAKINSNKKLVKVIIFDLIT